MRCLRFLLEMERAVGDGWEFTPSAILGRSEAEILKDRFEDQAPLSARDPRVLLRSPEDDAFHQLLACRRAQVAVQDRDPIVPP
jgi:hypothetical protein